MKLNVGKIDRGGAVVIFQVFIGVFSMNVTMLNINLNSHEGVKNIIARGSYGEIIELEENLVAKRYMFRE